MIIEIEKNVIEGIRIICDRYYFGLFNEITTNEDEEFIFRDALFDFLKSVDNEKRICDENKLNNL